MCDTKMEFDMVRDFVRPDMSSKCTWHKDTDSKSSPHNSIRNYYTNEVLPNILHTIGNTPLVKLNKIPQSFDIKCNVYAKCEYFNPGGSVKDRIGFRMVEEAERAGILKPGAIIIEPSSGNTGIGLALAAAVKSYRCIVVLPDKNSKEKVAVLRALGAKIIRTPTEVAFNSPESLIVVAQKLQKQIPNSIILNQYRNPGNPLAHYDTTGQEIVESLRGNVDMVVLGAGTGGTVTGVGRKLKEACPACAIVAVDALGSILAEPEELNKIDVTSFEVEGIGYDFVPTVLDRKVVDEWIKIDDIESLTMAKRLIKAEGLLCGGSSGSALAAAMKAAKKLKAGQNCVVILPDGIRNYLSKFVSDNWMEARNLKPVVNTNQLRWWNDNVSNLNIEPISSVNVKQQCTDILQVMKQTGNEYIVVIDESSTIIGVATSNSIMTKLLSNAVRKTDKIGKMMVHFFSRVKLDSSVGLVSRILEHEPFVIVTESTLVLYLIFVLITCAVIFNYWKEKCGRRPNLEHKHHPQHQQSSAGSLNPRI